MAVCPLEPFADDRAWLNRLAGVFQALALHLSRLPVQEEQVAPVMTRIPTPHTPFQDFVLRCFLCESCVAVVTSRQALAAPLSWSRAADLVTRLRLDPDPIATFTRFVREMCVGDRVARTDGDLAAAISRRLECDYATRVTVEQMAGEYHISRVRLERLCRDRFGASFHQYLTSIRVRRGLELVTRGMKIEAAAASVGYKSKKDFYRAVKGETGLTPGRVAARESRTA